jgi:translation initiation factor IF-2
LLIFVEFPFSPTKIFLAFCTGIIYGFNVKVPENVKKLAKERKIEIKLFNIIYRLVEDLKLRLTAQLPTTEHDDILGNVRVFSLLSF